MGSGGSVIISMRPPSGNHPSCRAKKSWHIRPSQNIGMATPETVSTRMT